MRRNKARVGVTKVRRGWRRDFLASEIELIIRERERLLQAAGAAAALFSRLDICKLPGEARDQVRRLGEMLDALPEETLTDAMEVLLGRSRTPPASGVVR